MLSFSFQIYFDFSGYSDMAVGLARMAGFRLPINFNSPFKACSITEFWRRWHLTLTRFVTDYVYTPVSLAITRRAVRARLGPSAMFWTSVAVPVGITFVLLGIWHGAGWNFLLFGLMHGAMMALHQAWKKWRGALKLPAIQSEMALIVTFVSVSLTFVMFRADNSAAAVRFYEALFLMGGLTLPEHLLGMTAPLAKLIDVQYLPSKVWQGSLSVAWLALAASVCFTLPNIYEIMHRYRPAQYQGWPAKLPDRRSMSAGRKGLLLRVLAHWHLALLVIVIGLCSLTFMQYNPYVLQLRVLIEIMCSTSKARHGALWWTI